MSLVEVMTRAIENENQTKISKTCTETKTVDEQYNNIPIEMAIHTCTMSCIVKFRTKVTPVG